MFTAMTLTGCRATATAVLTLRGSGSGVIEVSVVLDKDAARGIGSVQDALRVADLQRAGWVVDQVTTAADGSVKAGVHHAFGSPAEAAPLLAALGPVRLAVSGHHGLVSSHVGVEGSVDLRNGVDSLGDAALDQALGVPSLNAALASLQQNGAVVPSGSVAVVAHLPGRPAGATGGGVVHGDTITWTVPLGSQLAFGARASSTDRTAEEWDLAAFGLVVAAGVTAVLQIRRRRGSRHHDRWSLARM